MARRAIDSTETNPVAEDVTDARPYEEEHDRDEAYRAPRPPAVVGRRGFFDIYKPGQGTYTRVGTAVGAGLLVLWGAGFAYSKFALVGSGTTTQYLQAGAAVAVILGAGLTLYWALALNRRVCDFLIATEGEMKKVSWTSRREIIGSTKVVIISVLMLSVVLFVVDILLMLFFTEIDVLRIVPDILSGWVGGSNS